MLLWLRSVCWVKTLDTPKWDILATDVAVYFDSRLRKLKLQTYQSISPAKVREKPPENAKKEGKLGVEGGKIPSLAENAAEMRCTTFIIIYIPDDRNSRNQVLGLVTSQAT